MLVFRVLFVLFSLLLLSFQNCSKFEAKDEVAHGPFVYPLLSEAQNLKVPLKSCQLDFMKKPYQCTTVSYGDHELQTYDLWLPNNIKSEDQVPLVIYIHGGGYARGDKESGYREGIGIEKYLDRGIAFATLNYRLSGDHPYIKGVTGEYPVQMRDSATALQDLRMRAPRYGLSRKNIALIGSSAGGGISLWLSLHDDLRVPKSETPRERYSSRVPCVAVSGTQTSLNLKELITLLDVARRPFVLDSGVPGLYGITAEQYLASPDRYQKLLAESMLEASPISHLSADDKGLKMLLTYARDYKEANIHSPEFGLYMAQGNPSALATEFDRKSLDDFEIDYKLMVNQGSASDDMQNIFNYVTRNCFAE